MVNTWVRSVATNVRNNGFFGSAPHQAFAPGETALRSFWNIGLHMTLTNPGQYPPGSSILRVGLLWAAEGLAALDTPTPITNGDADWMDIETLPPSSIVLASAVDNIWDINWAFSKDEDVKAQRNNSSATDFQQLYVCWEFQLDSAIAGFTIPWWHSSVDTLIKTVGP